MNQFRNLVFMGMLALQMVYAQVDQSKRIEMDLGEVDDIHIVEFREKKSFLAIYNDEKGDTKNEHKIVYDLYNENFQKVDTKTILINEKLRPFASDSRTDLALFTLYFDKKTKEIVIYKYDVEKKDIVEKRVACKEELKGFHEIEVIGNKLFLTFGDKKKIFCIVIDVDKAVYTKHNISGMGEDLTYFDLQRMVLPSGGSEIGVFCTQKIKRKNNLMVYVLMDDKGSLITSTLVALPQVDEDTKRCDITLGKLGDGGYLALGTYSKGSQSYTNGIYISKVSKDGSIGFDKTYNYLDIPNFTEYLSEKKQEKIEKKKARKEDKGKELNINYFAAMHDVIEKDGKYLLISEFYYPTYRTESRTVFVNGSSQTTYVTVFDGYKYTHALITSLDASGKMLWSNIFELSPAYKPYYVKKFITVNKVGDQVNLVFSSGSFLYSKTFSSAGKLLSDEKGEVIETDRENDKVKSTNGEIDHWFDRVFLWHGYQKIKNTQDGDGKRKRKVYFVNKLVFLK